ncbi:MAG: hypothetical protein HOI95_15935 [Chromatiales bacterium]|nr:hypothetical protein [Chromatiales bacterium]
MQSLPSFVRVLSATAAGQAILYLGACDTDIVVAALAGGDITTKVLALTLNAADDAALRSGAPADLRLSIHRQDPVSFLCDIESHRFAMVLIDEQAGQHRDAVLGLVSHGGICVGFGELAAPTGPEFEACPMHLPGVAWLATRRTHPLPQRKGGRRAKLRESSNLREGYEKGRGATQRVSKPAR